MSDSPASRRPATLSEALRGRAGATADAACWAPIEQHAEGPPPLGDVDEQLLQRREARGRGVLVELVEHDEAQRLTAGALLLGPDRVEQRADDEALGVVVEARDVDDVDAVVLQRHRRDPAGHQARRCAAAA